MGLFNSLKKKNQNEISNVQELDNLSVSNQQAEEELINEKVTTRVVNHENGNAFAEPKTKKMKQNVYVNVQENQNLEEQEEDSPEDSQKANNKTENGGKHTKSDNSPDLSAFKSSNKTDNKILTVINQKGGVGKSTTAINLGCALAERGKKILIIDLDPQGNTTSGLGIEKKELKHCIYDVLLNDMSINDISVKDAYKNVDVAPATINLAGAEVELVTEIARENRLKDAIDKVKANYDYVFVDCPPSLGLLTVNALVAADKLLIPIQTEFYALEGVTKLLDSMKRVKSRLNTNLDIFGVLLTMYDGRTTLAKQVADEVRKYFKDLVFETMIPRTVKISEAPSFGQPITQYEPESKGSIAYKNLAKEVVNRG